MREREREKSEKINGEKRLKGVWRVEQVDREGDREGKWGEGKVSVE